MDLFHYSADTVSIDPRDLKDGLTAALRGDHTLAQAMFGRAISDETLKVQVETILRNHMVQA